MSDTLLDPPFGAADLSNCERELIHLAGSVQPHGALLVLRESDLVVLQASANAETLLGLPPASLRGARLGVLGGDVADQVVNAMRSSLLMLASPIRCRMERDGASVPLHLLIHRQPKVGLVVEIELLSPDVADDHHLAHTLAETVAAITATPSLTALSDAIVRCVRELTGYDRVMVYQFDGEGHGEVIAEAKVDALEPLLGQHYPASDIPQRARELYIRNRVRVLVDVNYEPVPVVPRVSPSSGEELDMSLCSLRSMSPMHLQYLKNMGVTATLVTSLIREGRLWGLIACHHYSAKSVAYEVRAACELMSEIVSTRIAALENRAQVEAELFVRDLEHDLVSAATETGDWRDALFNDPRSQLLEPLGATGVALFYEGEISTAGETPSIPELRAFAAWIGEHVHTNVFQSACLPKLNPEFASLATATGVLVISLSRDDNEYLVWFRKEQLRTVTWAGNPNKPVTVGNTPQDLSPRRSFAAWSELVRHTATAWTGTELAIATAMQNSLVDVILQMRALRALIAERQATNALGVIGRAAEPMIIADGVGNVLLVNEAFHRLVERPLSRVRTLDDMVTLCADSANMRAVLRQITEGRRAWRGEMRLTRAADSEIHVAVRADPVPGLRGDVLGYIFLFTDVQRQREARLTRARVQRVIAESQVTAPLGGVATVMSADFNQLLSAILANASAAVMQFGDTSAEPATGALLEELEAATRRAADLTSQILGTLSRVRRSV